jgi:WD40 repeat protein
MSLHPSPIEGGKYLAAATDTSRNIIFEAGTHRQIRNLYGHQNDSYSNAKVAWSSNGQYLFGNTQEDSSICVWDVASSAIVRRSPGHEGSIRDIFSSAYSDTLATVSFDKTVKIWLNTF